MKKTVKHIFGCLVGATLAFGSLSESAFALFDAQLLLGQRSQELKFSTNPKTFDGTTTKVAFHLDPIPVIPISFGLALEQVSYSVSSSSDGFSKLTGMHITPEITVWTPSLPIVGLSLYAKLGFGIDRTTGTSSYTVEGLDPVDYDIEIVGQSIHIVPGVSYSLLPLVSLLLEYDIGSAEWERKGFDVAGITVADETIDANSSTILFGAEIGI